MSEAHIEALETARTDKAAALDIRDVLGAYAGPFFRRSAQSSAGWRNYCQLIARVGTPRRWQPIVGKYFDATSEVFTAQLERLYPRRRRRTCTRGSTS